MRPLVTNKRGAALALSISTKTVDRLIADGKLSHVKIRGQVRIPIDEVERLARGEAQR
jgi:excisionase family DNA binding protein